MSDWTAAGFMYRPGSNSKILSMNSNGVLVSQLASVLKLSWATDRKIGLIETLTKFGVYDTIVELAKSATTTTTSRTTLSPTTTTTYTNRVRALGKEPPNADADDSQSPVYIAESHQTILDWLAHNHQQGIVPLENFTRFLASLYLDANKASTNPAMVSSTKREVERCWPDFQLF